MRSCMRARALILKIAHTCKDTCISSFDVHNFTIDAADKLRAILACGRLPFPRHRSPGSIGPDASDIERSNQVADHVWKSVTASFIVTPAAEWGLIIHDCARTYPVRCTRAETRKNPIYTGIARR